MTTNDGGVRKPPKPGRQSADRDAIDSGTDRSLKVVAFDTGANGRDVRAFRTALRNAALRDHVRLERQGVPVGVVRDLIDRSGIPARTLQEAAGIPKAIFSKKIQGKTRVSGAPGQAVVGMLNLINAVEYMVCRDPAPGAENFDAEAWVGSWIQSPIPALGGQRPVDLMGTPAGRQAVMRVVTADREGVYL